MMASLWRSWLWVCLSCTPVHCIGMDTQCIGPNIQCISKCLQGLHCSLCTSSALMHVLSLSFVDVSEIDSLRNYLWSSIVHLAETAQADSVARQDASTCLKVCTALRSRKSPLFFCTRQLMSAYRTPGSLTRK